MGWDEQAAPIEAAFRAFFAEIAAGTPPPAEMVAGAFGRHLAAVRAEQLPPAARPGWSAALKLLKAGAGPATGCRIADTALDAMRSWPAARLLELLAALGAAHAEIEAAGNTRWNDAVRAQVAKAYL